MSSDFLCRLGEVIVYCLGVIPVDLEKNNALARRQEPVREAGLYHIMECLRDSRGNKLSCVVVELASLIFRDLVIRDNFHHIYFAEASTQLWKGELVWRFVFRNSNSTSLLRSFLFISIDTNLVRVQPGRVFGGIRRLWALLYLLGFLSRRWWWWLLGLSTGNFIGRIAEGFKMVLKCDTMPNLKPFFGISSTC
ncbi:hypothetical protein RRF57_008966 [Xylaria bambusicola]|uniref:Uncharacterized protein n=1 Tax=Xylaria bambusicola TaxID=326684 RepID=A0AAN7UQ74_9PEZI